MIYLKQLISRDGLSSEIQKINEHFCSKIHNALAPGFKADLYDVVSELCPQIEFSARTYECVSREQAILLTYKEKQ